MVAWVEKWRKRTQLGVKKEEWDSAQSFRSDNRQHQIKTLFSVSCKAELVQHHSTRSRPDYYNENVLTW